MSQVADQYLTLLSTDDLLKVTENTLKTAQDSYNLTKLQFDNGTAGSSCVRRRQWSSRRCRTSRRKHGHARRR